MRIPNCITAEELAKRLNLHIVTVNRWRCEGTGPQYVNAGRKVFYPLPLVEEWEMKLLTEGGTERLVRRKRKKSRIKRKA